MAIHHFGGYATKNDLRCTDGRIIRKDAFAHQDGAEVPLVWGHQRNDIDNYLGHAILENRSDGVYAYCDFNDTPKAMTAKTLVEHGDIKSLSIYANQLEQNGSDVVHGVIREVSLVMAGANPGATIDNLMIEHSDGYVETVDGEAIICCRIGIESNIEHADGNQNDGKTVKEIFDSMTEEQKNVVYTMLGFALQQSDEDEEEDEEDSAEQSEEETEEDLEHSIEGGNELKHNVFEGQDMARGPILTHADVDTIFSNARKFGSLREAAREFVTNNKDRLEHAIHGVTGSDYANALPEDVLFPDFRQVGAYPEMIMRPQEWVGKVWNATSKSPFSRIKSTAADITADEARARGYIKGKKKIEEVITMLKRVTSPQTVYKLQKMDRDDILDIVDFDVVAWLKVEMRIMLNEELARAILVGDGRMSGDESKINESNIRPVWKDDDLYTIHYTANIGKGDTDDEKADKFITAVHRSRKNYMGSGSPTMYTDTDTLTTLLLAKDKIGRRLYNTTAELASALRVSEIVEVPIMEGLQRDGRVGVEGETGKKFELMALIVNLADYTVGADRGGAVAMFDDFDIDFNKYTYLIETRCSGALRKPYSAIAIEVEAQGE